MIRPDQRTGKTVILRVTNRKYRLPLFFTVFSSNPQRVNTRNLPFAI